MKLRFIYFLPCIISLIFLCILGFQVWPQFLAVHDSPLKLLPTETQTPLFSFWGKDNFGYTNYINHVMSLYPLIFSHILLKLGVFTFIMQITLYFIILSTLMYSAWFSIHKFLILLRYKPALWQSFIGSLFFTFNLYMIASWHGGSVDGIFLTYATAPLLLYLCTKNLLTPITVKDKVTYVILFVISLNTIPFAAALFLAYFIPFFYITYRQKKLIVTIKSFAFITFFSTGIAAFYIYIIILAFIRSDPSPLRNNAIAYAFSDYGLLGNFKLYFDWTVNQIWGSRHFHSYFPYYDNPLLSITMFILWFIIFWTIIQKLKSLPKQILGYLFAILAVSLFVTKSLNAPLGFVNQYMYEYLPFMNLFRTPDTKFGLPFITVMSFLIAMTLVIAKKKIIFVSLILVVIALHIGTFFTGIPIIETKNNEFHTRIVTIPEEYNNIANLLNADSREGTIFMYPGLSYGNYNYMNGSGLNGQDILGKLISRPKFYSDGFIFGKAEKKYDELIHNPSAQKFGENSIRYILIRKDIYDSYPSTTLKTIASVPDIKRIHSSHIADIYEITDKFYKPYIVINGNSTSVPYSVNEMFPNVYKIVFKNPGKRVLIQFNTNYHPDWHLFSKNQININSHTASKNNSNMWDIQITPQIENSLYIIFIPQVVFIIPILISLVFLVWFIRKYILHTNGI